MQKLTVVDKINKTLEYCDFVKDCACYNMYTVCFRIETESTGGEIETEQQCTESIQIDYTALHNAICRAVLDAQQNSQNYDCISSVKVHIETYNTEGKLIDEDPIDEYEIIFEKGIEVR